MQRAGIAGSGRGLSPGAAPAGRSVTRSPDSPLLERPTGLGGPTPPLPGGRPRRHPPTARDPRPFLGAGRLARPASRRPRRARPAA